MVLIAAANLGGAATSSADPSPDIAVTFARGTGEPPGVGRIGQAVVDSIRAQVGGWTVGAYGGNFPAPNFTGGREFTRIIVDGTRDQADHVQGVIANCLDVTMVLGGYSLSAVASGIRHIRSRPGGCARGVSARPVACQVSRPRCRGGAVRQAVGCGKCAAFALRRL
ncbi:MAG: cutinase family protein [Mycobacterium sp.]